MTTGEVIALIKAFGGSGGGSSGGGGLVVNVTVDPETDAKVCDKTAGEIWAVANAGGTVVFKIADENGSAIDCMAYAEHNGPNYTFNTGMYDMYSAESANDYPKTDGGK